MDRSSARSAPAGPSIRRRCLAGGPRCEFRSPKAARRDLSEGATRGLRLARNDSSGASRRSRLASTSAGIVHATGAPAVGSGRRIPPSQPAAAAPAPATPPPSAAPATTASRNGVVEPLPGGWFEATPFLPAFLPIPPEPAFLSFLFGCVTATHKGRSHVGASSLAAYV